MLKNSIFIIHPLRGERGRGYTPTCPYRYFKLETHRPKAFFVMFLIHRQNQQHFIIFEFHHKLNFEFWLTLVRYQAGSASGHQDDRLIPRLIFDVGGGE